MISRRKFPLLNSVLGLSVLIGLQGTSGQLSVSLNWLAYTGGGGDEVPHQHVLDPDGNSLMTGFLDSIADFDPGPGVLNLEGQDLGDLYIQKLDPNGALIWAYLIGNSLWNAGMSISSDPDGNVLVTGFFEGTVDFDPGPGLSNLTSLGDRDVFILKLDPDGNFMWVRTIGDSYFEIGEMITTDLSGNIFVTGTFDGLADLDPGPATSFAFSSGSDDIFVLKLDPLGNTVWAKAIGGIGFDYPGDIVVTSAGDVVVTGFFFDTVDFDPGGGTFPLTSAGERDGFVLTLGASGNFLWARSFGGSSADSPTGLAVDEDDNLYVTGFFESSADFDPGAGVELLTSSGYFDVFVLALDPVGIFSWAKNIGGAMDELGYDIHMYDDNYLLVSGVYAGDADFDPGAGTFMLLNNGSGDAFGIVLNSSNGEFLMATGVGGTGWDDFVSISADPFGAIYVYGSFEDDMDVDPGTGTMTVSSQGQSDMFLVKLCFPIAETIDTASCVAITSPSGLYLWTTSGTYSDTLGAVGGCDSILTVNLTIYPEPVIVAPPDTVICEGDQITLSASGGDTYVWFDGVANGVPFVPVTSWNYHVIGFDTNGCGMPDSTFVTVLPRPQSLIVSGDQNFCLSDSLVLWISGADSAFWQPETISSDTFGLVPTGNVTVFVKGFENGCSADFGIELTMSECPFLPGNSITPDGDGLNDFLEIRGIEAYPDNEVSILDRWGSTVFSTKGYDNSDEAHRWEGRRRNGDLLHAGTYYYVVRHDKLNGQTGWVQVVR